MELEEACSNTLADQDADGMAELKSKQPSIYRTKQGRGHTPLDLTSSWKVGNIFVRGSSAGILHQWQVYSPVSVEMCLMHCFI